VGYSPWLLWKRWDKVVRDVLRLIGTRKTGALRGKRITRTNNEEPPHEAGPVQRTYTQKVLPGASKPEDTVFSRDNIMDVIKDAERIATVQKKYAYNNGTMKHPPLPLGVLINYLMQQ
jgi:hypothetical protein